MKFILTLCELSYLCVDTFILLHRSFIVVIFSQHFRKSEFSLFFAQEIVCDKYHPRLQVYNKHPIPAKP
jgi:hypothetical protein